MEEVDSIILHQLKQIQCDFEENPTSLRELDHEDIMRCLIKCITLIDSNLANGLTISPQSNMASKYKLCSQLSDICVDLGFKGDVGYQTFLYCNESDLRRVFLFLLEKIPKDEGQDMTTTNYTGDTLIERLVKKPVNITWLPPMKLQDEYSDGSQLKTIWRSKPISGILNASSIVGNRIAPNKRNYYDNYAKICLDDIASLMEWNSALMDPSYARLSSSKAKIIEPIEFVSQSNVIKNLRQREIIETATLTSLPSEENQKSVAALDGDSSEIDNEEIIKQQVSQLEKELEEIKEKLSSLNEILNQQSLTINETEAILKSESDKLISLRTSDNTVSDLRNQVDQVRREIASFQEQWKVISEQLHDKINKIQEEKSMATKKRANFVQELHDLRKNSRSKLKEITEKEGLISQMKEKIKGPLPPSRSSYTQRIMELVNNVKKQNDETKKILLETRQLQKDINTASGKVQRAYTITDETIFRDAKNSEWNRKCYKLLATMHKNYDALLDCVNAIGTIRREILQLEEAVDNEKDNKTIANLNLIQRDLEKLKMENRLLKDEKNVADDS